MMQVPESLRDLHHEIGLLKKSTTWGKAIQAEIILNEIFSILVYQQIEINQLKERLEDGR